jgi:hypothetical protein
MVNEKATDVLEEGGEGELAIKSEGAEMMASRDSEFVSFPEFSRPLFLFK